MIPGGAPVFLEMVRYAPLRTVVFSFGPPLWGLIQLVNAYLHDGALPYVAAFAAAMVAFSFLITRYHAASFRRMRLSERWVRQE